ncbi:hypothetical protein BKA82DRAFT_991996 [Pisolithus tinctorius]|uniref:Uncharacterized protein n=1 Tax=Pisolithus tinctorius Marx 270 TaxID=870435 RepID=A0A0C3L0G7_PISTI|nr:hypothetical protein BKA82DRAFT_991996 [Pisolithus tinctorius]KIO15262.1 hypothetical protein M404DRAFT_991996 [Pisolithus tinctorius Marx 270]
MSLVEMRVDVETVTDNTGPGCVGSVQNLTLPTAPSRSEARADRTNERSLFHDFTDAVACVAKRMRH